MSTVKLPHFDPKTHPANQGKNFAFDGSISEEVLRNYLSRAMTLSFLNAQGSTGDQLDTAQDCAAVINYCGVKYVGRSCCAWLPHASEAEHYAYMKETMANIHAVDPDVIFEACIFETADRRFESFEIPQYVCEAFGQPYTGRHFEYEKMLFPDGTYVDHWDKDSSVPDMNQLETQMWFYFRGCLYIDLGFEALHYGQVWLIGEQDENYHHWSKVMNMIRDYARVHARRHFVLLNAHVHGMLDEQGKLMFDFHCYPIRPVAIASDPPHPASETDPQRCELIMGWGNSLYGRSMGGETHSGWKTDSLPYFVEIDNYGCQPKELLNTQVDYYPWGYDECSWFAQQPKWYRREWLEYADRWVRENDPAGYVEMLGTRGVSVWDPDAPDGTHREFYYVNSDAFQDAEIVFDIWSKQNKQ